MSTAPVEIAFIGGTGVYAIEGIENLEQIDIDTPFGKPSAPITVGTLEGVRCAFVARHGHGHRLLPEEVPFRANVCALKMLGVKYLCTFSACGSLKEEMAPGDMVIVDQFIDRTKARKATFFGDGVVAHVGFGQPTCANMNAVLKKAVEAAVPNVKLHSSGATYLCMEGPIFSTKAESNLYRSWDASVIGMTALTEAKLAREAEMAYCLAALVTDYDCWKEEEVTAESVIKVLKGNGENVQKVVKKFIQMLAGEKFVSKAHSALQAGLMTPASSISAEKKKAMNPIIGKYIPLE